MELFDSTGKRITIERELFRGGEGTIHPVTGNPALFAKLYHRSIDAAKQAKLAAMTSAVNDSLLRVAAWPEATLHDRAGGRMVGFVMPRFDGQRWELHELYRPGTRKQTFRQADWAFLFHAARNIAAAMATVHGAGHVVGDVNQRNFIVGRDATVKVLDCDSFQIRDAARTFFCPVGVLEFTPPELQNRTLDGVERTPDHDAFGLAVLTFQLLFMGRHPFVGRFLGAGEMPIERAIAEGRFAFGAKRRSHLMESPPNLIAFESLPPRLAALFETAFNGGGRRPGARVWQEALDAAQAELGGCTSEPLHKFYKALPHCPWCALERAAGVFFFIGPAGVLGPSFDLGKLWAAIVVTTALPYEEPARPAVQVVGTPPLASLVVRRRVAAVTKVAGVLLLIGSGVVLTDLLLLMAIAAVILAVVPLPGGTERKQRSARLRDAESAWIGAYRAAEDALSVQPLLRKRKDLQQLKDTYESIDAEKRNELAKLTQNAREIQLQHYLEHHLIRAHKIPDIGAQRKATLAAWGIDTAADVSWQSVGAVQGFGPMLQARLMAWRHDIESRFVFDVKRAIPQPDVDAVEYRWRRRKTDLEQQLRAGAEEARRTNQYIRQRRLAIAKDLESPARAWAQASADVDIIHRALSLRRTTL
jgi:DNA-binding helix-hairpin-helix protein with protein kinase domain